MPTASRIAAHASDLSAYVEDELIPLFARLGFTTKTWRHPAAPGPFLLAERIEDPRFVTILQYGHGDVVAGLDEKWSAGLAPFRMTERDGRWYGRGTADNKGQHAVNLAALEAVLAVRGSLGFNCKYLIEMGEESGSPGLEEICRDHAAELAADVFIGSDGPRLALDRPTIFLGARGGISFEVAIEARKDFQHSGNWGGILANPGIELCHAIAALVDRRGRILVPALTPGVIPDNVREALKSCRITPEPGDPPIDAWWGEPGLSAEEKVFAWSSFEVMEFECGNLAQPLYAIPPRARARLQLRFPVGVDPDAVVPAVRSALAEAGFDRVQAGTRRIWCSRRVGSIQTVPGSAASPPRSRRPWALHRRSCRTSVARSPTTSSATGSACRRSGSRIPIRAACSMRRTSICRFPSRGRAWS